MSKMFRRFSFLLSLLILVGTGFLAKSISQKQKKTEQKTLQPVLEREISVMKVTNTKVRSKLAVQGTLEAISKVNIFTEVTGTTIRTNKILKAGDFVKEGEILIHIDTEKTQLNLLSQKSILLNSITLFMPSLKVDYPESFKQWDTYLETFNIKEPIRPLPTPLNKQEKYFIASKNLLSQYYTVKMVEEQLRKHTIYAPFSGTLTQSNIHPGTLVQGGQKMGELMGSLYEMKTAFTLDELKYIGIGSKVNLKVDKLENNWTGRVKRISKQINPSTQTVNVFITVSGKDLREGMYMNGTINTRFVENALKIPVELLDERQQVYIVKNGKLLLKKVDVHSMNTTHAIIRGLDNQTLLLKEKIIGVYEGLKVKPRVKHLNVSKY